VTALTDAQKKEAGVRGGVRIEAATEAAARAGLREGDVILQVANIEVLTVKEFEAVLGKHDKTKALNVLFRRGDWTQFAVIRAGR
jgi:serine protease Do